MSFPRRIIRLVLAPAALILAVCIASSPVLALPTKDYGATLKQMLDAIQLNKYEQFTSAGDASFQQGFTQEKFEKLAKLFAPKLHEGYSVVFVTSLRQRDYLDYVWKLSFKNASDEFLIHLAIRNGYVIGFITR